MGAMSQIERQPLRVAAIYARVSSERQREGGTIESQVAGLHELAQARGLVVPEQLVFLDEGFSGAMLLRPALERLRDRAAEGCFEVLLCHCPDRLARRYAYQVLLLEELDRAGVEVVFLREGERSGSPEDELLRQFQGMIAEYERAQIRERTRRGKLYRARQGSQAVLVCAPFGYRYLRKTDDADGYFQVDPAEAEVVREVFRRYSEGDESIAEIARALSARGVPTRTGKAVWDRSTVWGMLRNPAYRGQAAFGKTQTSGQRAKPTRPARARGERHGRRETRRDQPPENWTLVPVPALISEQTFELAQARLQENKRFAARNTKQPTLLQGILVCRECGYACYRTSTRTSSRRIYYYRCIGSDNYRHVGGRVCQSRPIRADELDDLVWAEVRHLLEQPELVRAEIKRRLEAVRSQHPAARRREGLERELARVRAGTARLIEAYQEQLIALEELRERMPKLRKRETTLTAQLSALEAELHDAETYLKLAETLEGFLARLADGLDQLTVHEQQRVLRLVVREVLIGGEQDNVTIRHSIPTPSGDGSPSCQLRGSSQDPALRGAGPRLLEVAPLVHDPGLEKRLHQPQHAPVCDPRSHPPGQGGVVERVEARLDIRLDDPLVGAARQLVDLGDRVLGSAPRSEAIRAGLEVGLEDRLQHQLEGGLHDPVAQRRDPQPTRLAAALGDPPLLDRYRPEAPGAKLLTQLLQEPLDAQHPLDMGGRLPVHASRARPSIPPHPAPGHQQRRPVTDEVVEVRKPPRLIVACPPVQLPLDPEYPLRRLIRRRPRRATIQRRPPRLPDGRRKPAVSLRHAPGFPRLGLLRRLRPRPAARADTVLCLPRRARRPPDGFPRSLSLGRRGWCPAFPLRA